MTSAAAPEIPADAARRAPTSDGAPAASRFLRGSHVLWLLVLLGVALRGWAYAAGTSLWLDEILLGRNILELPMGELLTKPLHLDQVAPRGFLLVERLAVLALGPNEWALRLFPFLAGVAALVAFRRLAERTLDGYAVPFAVALFAIGVPFIKYGAEVKQYELDALVAVVLLLVAVDLRERDQPLARRLGYGGLAFVLIWFSQPSAIVMAGIGLAFAVEWMAARDRRGRAVLSTTIPLWAAASLVAVVAGLRSMTPATRAFMDDFWRQGFPPLPPSLASVGWFWRQAISVFDDPTLLQYRWPTLFVVVALLGAAATWRRRRGVALLLAGPLVMAALAALAQQYPLRGRLMLYLVPSLLLAVAAGAEWARRVAARAHPALGTALMLGLAIAPVAALLESPPPYEVEHHRAMLAHLRERRQPGDVLYVFPLTRIGVLFYGPRYGVGPGDFVTGVCDREDTRAYLRDLDRFRGTARLWVLGSAARPFRTARPAAAGYLGAVGVKRDSLERQSPTFGRVSLELYDLSDSTRLAAADAERFPVAPMPTDPRPGCRPWARPDGPVTLR